MFDNSEWKHIDWGSLDQGWWCPCNGTWNAMACFGNFPCCTGNKVALQAKIGDCLNKLPVCALLFSNDYIKTTLRFPFTKSRAGPCLDIANGHEISRRVSLPYREAAWCVEPRGVSWVSTSTNMKNLLWEIQASSADGAMGNSCVDQNSSPWCL